MMSKVYQVIVAASKNVLVWDSFDRTETSHEWFQSPKNTSYVMATLYSHMFSAWSHDESNQ